MTIDRSLEPCGLRSLRNKIESICKKAYIYQRCEIRPKHLIVPLDPKSGRTMFLEYLTNMFKLNKILRFNSGLDDFIEVSFDGSLGQLEIAFSQIDSAAIYENEFTGIIGMDISDLATHLEEIQFKEFLKRIEEICKHAYVVFFVHNRPSKNEERLIQKLTDAVRNIERIDIEPYSINELAQILVKELKSYGLRIKGEGTVKKILTDYLKGKGTDNVQDALSIAQIIAGYADYSKDIPVVDKKRIKRFILEDSKEEDQ